LKLKPEAVTEFRATLPKGSRLEALNFNHWYKVILPVQSGEIMSLDTLSNRPGVSKAQPNFKISLPPLPGLPALRKALVEKGIVRCEDAGLCEEINVLGDNPPIPPIREPRSGNDPLLNYQWGVLDIGATAAWRKNVGNPGVVVAVIDTGVDYTHEDLR